MNALLENAIIDEIKCDSDFIYVLNQANDLVHTEYKVLQSAWNEYFVPCMKMTYNGRIAIYYLTEGLKPLSSLVTDISPADFITISTNIIGNLIEIKNNGFLSFKKIDADFDKIYIDRETLKVKMIYLPINNVLYDEPGVFEDTIKTKLVECIANNDNVKDDFSCAFGYELDQKNLTLEELYSSFGKRLLPQEPSFFPPGSLEMGRNSHRAKMRLVAMDSQYDESVIVNKSHFVIGKRASEVDGVLTISKAISRVHCMIVTDNESYYIQDLNSANGTYVNNKRVYEGERIQIENGDIVRLADKEFEVVIN